MAAWAKAEDAVRRCGAGQPGENGFAFLPVVHEPGERTVMGRRYPANGVEQGRAILKDLSNRPETARRLARKIAVHFVSDTPSPELVSALERAWTQSRGDLAVVAKALATHPDSWAPEAVKVKTPYEFIVSAHRAMGTRPRRVQPLQQALVQMGQRRGPRRRRKAGPTPPPTGPGRTRW